MRSLIGLSVAVADQQAGIGGNIFAVGKKLS
jgi:hypothetical protein